jgi:hypothetical protein
MVSERGLVSRQWLGKRKAHRCRIEKANHREIVTLTLDPNIKGRWRGRTYLAVTTTTAGRRLDIVQKSHPSLLGRVPCFGMCLTRRLRAKGTDAKPLDGDALING